MANIENTKILIVDDSNTVVNILKKALLQIGIRDYSVAYDGAQAWVLLQQEAQTHPYDLILCDWIMPEISGIELLALIRASENKAVAKMRFVMVTGSSDKVKLAMEAGADNFIAKPFTPDDLKNKLEFVLR